MRFVCIFTSRNACRPFFTQLGSMRHFGRNICIVGLKIDENEGNRSSENIAATFEAGAVKKPRFQTRGSVIIQKPLEMEALVLGWYILVETGSVLLLTMFGALLFLGTLLSPMLGVVADRIGQRRHHHHAHTTFDDA